MSLAPRILYGDLDLTAPPYLVRFGAMYGRPENVYEALVSMMQDGEPISSTRTSNRQLELPVMIEESDLRGMAEAERALILECEKPRNTLTVDPGDGWGSATVFDTFKAQPTHEREDAHEMAGVRMFSLTIPALPFVRSATAVTIPAMPAAAIPSTVVISDGTSATGWVNNTSSASSVTSSGGRLLLPGEGTVVGDTSGVRLEQFSRATLTLAATDFSATPYVSLEVQRNYDGGASGQRVRMYADGAQLPAVMGQLSTPAYGTDRWTFLCSDASVTTLRVEVDSWYDFPPGTTGVGPGSATIDNIKRSNVPPTTSTARQLLRSLEVKGSVRTPVCLSVEHATTGLGDVIVYTGGPQADLRRWRTGGAGIADSSLVSGAYDTTGLSGGPVFDIPSALLKRGGHVLMARVRADGASGDRAVVWSVGSQTGVTRMPLTSSWSLVTLAGVIAPDVDVLPSSSALTRVSLAHAAGSSAVQVDEVWLFYVGEGAALTVVSCGTGTPAIGTVHNRLWIRPADTERPYPTIWRGTQADMSDAIHAGPVTTSWGDHRFMPPETQVQTVTTGVENALVSGSYFPSDAFHAVD